MKKFIMFLYLYFMASVVFAHSIVLENKTNYPEKGRLGQIAVQWATSARAVQKANNSMLKGAALSANSFVLPNQKGKIQLSSPNNARYFRLIAWSSDKPDPDLITNWVGITPNKTYVVNQNQLVPLILMAGSGC